MQKNVVIKKNSAHRMGIRILTVLSTLFAIALTLCMKQGKIMLLFLPLVLILGVLFCYYETWQIGLGSDIVYKKIFFLEFGAYSYSQIKDITKSYSYTDREYVCIRFANGKRVQFCMDDENANKAIRQICRHRSIRMV